MAAISTAIIVGAAIAGTAAVASSVVASSGAKKAAKTQAQAQEQQIQAQQAAAAKEAETRQVAADKKQAAIENIPFPTFLSTPEGVEQKKTLQDRVAGRGLVDVSAQTAPVASQIRAGLEERTIPAITSTASARGLGRSTIPVSQIGQASQAAERDIAQRVQDLELIRQDQIGTAVTQFGQLAETEATSQQKRATFERQGEFSVADTIAGDASLVRDNEFAIAETIASKGATEAAGQLLNSQILAAGLIGVGNAAQIASRDILDAVKAEKDGRLAGQVNIGTIDTTTPARPRLLGLGKDLPLSLR